MKSLLLFHHNLAFSSIAKDQRQEVVARCYMPLLDFAEETDTKINVEAPAWTLRQCQKIFPSYVTRLRRLIHEGLVELIGSGYCQIIGPLVPYEVNIRNQEIGLDWYQSLVGVQPETLLINEMSFSPGLLDSVKNSGYRRIVMDADNIALAAGLSSKADLSNYDFISNSRDSKVEVVWSDSILFQKFQRVIHGGLSLNEYIDYVSQKMDKDFRWLPIYTNDVEIFNFRPGRFKEEAAIATDEWSAIRNVIEELKATLNLDFRHLAESNSPTGKTLYLDRPQMPVAVKKQPKYNITRWAVTGRSDSELNAYCYSELKKLKDGDTDSHTRDWERLCYLWSSDFRTHIHESRWSELEELLDSHSQKQTFDWVMDPHASLGANVSSDFDTASHGDVVKREGSMLAVSTSKVRMVMNVAKGGAIEEIGFKRHDFMASIGSFVHGALDEIDHAADFYSGSVLVEDFELRQRYTDYQNVDPVIYIDESYVNIFFRMYLGGIAVVKKVSVGLNTEVIKTQFWSEEFPVGHRIIRVGNFLFMNDDNNIHIEASTGGVGPDVFVIDDEFDHTASVSSFVSARTGFCAPEECLKIGAKTHKIKFEWDNSIGYLFPMMKHIRIGEKFFTRLIFSKSELDDTSRKRAANINASFTISPCEGDI